jgi:hypothetical protein
VGSSLARAVSLIIVVWALVSVIAAGRNAIMRGPDPVAALETEFRALSRALPPSAHVGFLRYDSDDDRADRVMTYYVAQYTLAPRLVEKRTDLEFIIVAPDAPRPGRDVRLDGFVPVATSREGYSVYQRRPLLRPQERVQ